MNQLTQTYIYLLRNHSSKEGWFSFFWVLHCSLLFASTVEGIQASSSTRIYVKGEAIIFIQKDGNGEDILENNIIDHIVLFDTIEFDSVQLNANKKGEKKVSIQPKQVLPNKKGEVLNLTHIKSAGSEIAVEFHFSKEAIIVFSRLQKVFLHTLFGDQLIRYICYSSNQSKSNDYLKHESIVYRTIDYAIFSRPPPCNFDEIYRKNTLVVL